MGHQIKKTQISNLEGEEMAIKTVIFDIGGVLVDFSWENIIRKQGFDEDMVQRIGNASVRSSAWDEFDRGVLDTKGIIDGFVKNDPEIEDEIRLAFSDLTGLLIKRERTIPWIKELKGKGYKVLVLSNFSKQALDANPFMQEFLDEIDGGILSYKDKVIKPDRAIYELITKRYDLVPGECVFIDDTEKNIIAARDFGMNGIVFKSYEQVESELQALGVC
ncbi:HAD family hydrolase [Butyrivibrio sp. WCD3002]|uniref:HAD family hydrolase n=1 Tax=Butyrivibrio sp. WCD3002 TaxID=1280676 RepID=UPI00040F638A